MTTNSGLGRQNLGSAFAPSTNPRAAALSGRLAPVTEDEAKTPEAAPAETEKKSERASSSTSTPDGKKRRAPKPAKKVAARTGEEQTEAFPVYVPAAVLGPFKARRDELGTSNTLLVFDAIDSLIDQDSDDPLGRLRQLVEQSMVGTQQRASLFARQPERLRDSIYVGQHTQLVLRLTPSNRRVVEDLVADTNAKDRGHLVTVALVNYLDIEGER